MQRIINIAEPIMLTLVRSLVLQGNSSEDEVPISSKEFYLGISLVCGALIAFGLMMRIFGS